MRILALGTLVSLLVPTAAAAGEAPRWAEYRTKALKRKVNQSSEDMLVKQVPELVAKVQDRWLRIAQRKIDAVIAEEKRERKAEAAAALVAATTPDTVPAPTGGYVAPTGSVWDAVVACEAGGNWSLVTTGNGYYFAMQFHPDTWLAYGGTQAELDAGVAPSPSRLIEVAERVLAGQGPNAWPNCFP